MGFIGVREESFISIRHIMQVLLKYYDTNGHNFGVETDVPNLSETQKVFVKLPDDERARQLRAIESYRKALRTTLRSPRIDRWLRSHANVGDVFTATLEISERINEHIYYDIKKR